MIRRLFTILSAVSLAIFLAMLALFLRGQLRGDTIQLMHRRTSRPWPVTPLLQRRPAGEGQAES